jgi:hypothetical protein
MGIYVPIVIFAAAGIYALVQHFNKKYLRIALATVAVVLIILNVFLLRGFVFEENEWQREFKHFRSLETDTNCTIITTFTPYIKYSLKQDSVDLYELIPDDKCYIIMKTRRASYIYKSLNQDYDFNITNQTNFYKINYLYQKN